MIFEQRLSEQEVPGQNVGAESQLLAAGESRSLGRSTFSASETWHGQRVVGRTGVDRSPVRPAWWVGHAEEAGFCSQY